MKTLRIYTDGACSGNQNSENRGGWGAILEYGEHRKEICGGEANTTNNRMEMKALIEAFKAVKKPGQRIEVFSDSAYLGECFRQGWYKNWQKNGWKTASKKPVENRELWEELLFLAEAHEASFYRVKGHINIESEKYEREREELYRKFVSYNGTGFSQEDFEYIVKMNNRADELANLGMREAAESEDLGGKK